MGTKNRHNTHTAAKRQEQALEKIVAICGASYDDVESWNFDAEYASRLEEIEAIARAAVKT